VARGESITSPRRLLAVERQVNALRLRARGHTYGQIAAALGYASRRGAHNAVSRMTRRVTRARVDEVELLVDLQRVDELFLPMFARALAGDLAAIAGCLGLMEWRAALLANIPAQ
jgi:hypothetical protein